MRNARHRRAEKRQEVGVDAVFQRLTEDHRSDLRPSAVKYGSALGLVDISCLRADRFIAIAVEDDGDGIAPESVEEIFVMGVRGNVGERSGCGIGPAVVKAIAQRAGGDVRVEPSRLGGARFVLRFPAG